MNNKIIISRMITSVFLIILLSFGFASAETHYVQRGESIQTAINAASLCDIIIVYNGTYSENVRVNKTLTLVGRGMPVVDAGGSGIHVPLLSQYNASVRNIAINVTADGCVIEGFYATGAAEIGCTGCAAGIKVSSNGNVIRNNIVKSNKAEGIIVCLSSNNRLINNTASNNNNGIFLMDSFNNSLAGNTANSNKGSGIELDFSSNNSVIGNTINSNSGNGIFVCASNNTLINNTASDNHAGIELHNSNNIVTDNNVSNNTYGIFLLHSSNNRLVGNIANSNKAKGIELQRSSNNTLICNNANQNNEWGIYLCYSSNNNTLTNNTVLHNKNNIVLDTSSSNNTFINGITDITFVNNTASQEEFQKQIEEFVKKELIDRTQSQKRAKTPAFEAVFAIAGLLAVIYLLRRNG